ncbi:MAG TPA: hypothetical protein VN634_14120 [Candidatus Limnocylindrales bacterium]|nr:hypothetical protein [Candidatus Limnocylindrales bacterium]
MKSNRFRKCILVGVASALPAILPVVLPQAADAQISVSIGIPLPPPIVFAAPPELVVLPGSYVYVAADLAEDVYFVDGWWWRPWQGHWYRSHSYDRGWDRYSSVPSFYGGVNHGWRNDYRERRWQGHDWNYQRMPQQRVASNWSSWKSNNYWDSQQHWGVPDMQQQSRSEASHPSSHSASRGAQHSPGTHYRADTAPSQRAGHDASRQIPAQRTEHRAGGSHASQNAAGNADHSQGHGAKAQGHGGQSQGHSGHSQGHSPGHGNGHE